MKQGIAITLVVFAAVLAGCRKDETVITPAREAGEGTSGRYPGGELPAAGLTNPGDQRSFNPTNAARGLDLRADWSTTGRKGAHDEHGLHPAMQFGAQGAQHNGPESTDERAAEPSLRDAPTRNDNPKHEPVPSPHGANPSGAPPHH